MSSPKTFAHVTEEVLVLLSGGLDSTACVDFYKQLGRPPCAAFVDYGQLAAKLEAEAAKAVARHYSIPLFLLSWRGAQPKGSGLIPGRNGFLISAALMERPESVSVIAIGIHAGTQYPDCSESFLTAIQATVRASENGRVNVAAPFSSWKKSDIIQYCAMSHVPVSITYSCELGTCPPCGTCLSCLDRRALLASS